MNRIQAIALVQYLQRGQAIIPTTLAEADHLKGAIATVEGIANGLVEVDVKPLRPENIPAKE